MELTREQENFIKLWNENVFEIYAVDVDGYFYNTKHINFINPKHLDEKCFTGQNSLSSFNYSSNEILENVNKGKINLFKLEPIK